ncbi:MAG: adenine deaminase [Deltaproteobacteria bacterium]|nr:adenine deaminase [Deltaproteobacteria bacterium]
MTNVEQGQGVLRRDISLLAKKIQTARGEHPADLVLKGGRVVNLFSGEILETDIAVYNNTIVGLNDTYKGKKEVDIRGKWVIPGLIDGHIHIESSMLTPSALAQALLIHGTTAIVADPHEIANVMGLDGIQFMLDDSRHIPFDTFFMAPSCVPATHLETAGAELNADDLASLRDEPAILGLAEMMNFPGVLGADPGVLEKIVRFQDCVVDGHCPMLTGRDLQAYLTAGIGSDHECSTPEEALEKIRSGMMLMIREGTSARNLDALLPVVNPQTAHRCCLVSDDLHAEDIQERGHLDFVIRKCVASGLDPVTAVRLTTLNPAGYFGLNYRGAIAPGYVADMVVLDDLKTVQVHSVYKNGRLMVQNGQLMGFPQKEEAPVASRPFRMSAFNADSLKIRHQKCKARIIELIPGQIITRMCHETVQTTNGWVQGDTRSDLLKLCVVERHRGTGNMGIGLIRGFGLKSGALVSSVAHDSHNVIAVGVTDEEIALGVTAVGDMGGGLAVVKGNEILARVPLKVAGLMSHKPIDVLVDQLKAVKETARQLGCKVEDPFMSLSFLPFR